MYFVRLSLLCFMTLLDPLAGAAQHAELDALTVSESGEAYLKATRFRGIENQVGYFDPTRDPPPLKTEQQPKEETRKKNSSNRETITFGEGRSFFFVTASLVLLGIAYLIFLYGGGLPSAFSRKPTEGSIQSRKKAKADKHSQDVPVALDAILRMSDKTNALVALCKTLLARVIAAEGVLLQRSWTDRDSLRRVPRDHAHREALTQLVFASERAQFGGREISEAEFDAHIERLKPIWTTA